MARKERLDAQKLLERLVNVAVKLTDGTSLVDDEITFVHNGSPVEKKPTIDGMATRQFDNLADGDHFFTIVLGSDPSKQMETKKVTIKSATTPTKGDAELAYEHIGAPGSFALELTVRSKGKLVDGAVIYFTPPIPGCPNPLTTGPSGSVIHAIAFVGREFHSTATVPALGLVEVIDLYQKI